MHEYTSCATYNRYRIFVYSIPNLCILTIPNLCILTEGIRTRTKRPQTPYLQAFQSFATKEKTRHLSGFFKMLYVYICIYSPQARPACVRAGIRGKMPLKKRTRRQDNLSLSAAGHPGRDARGSDRQEPAGCCPRPVNKKQGGGDARQIFSLMAL